MKKNNKLLMIENQEKWNVLMNSLSKCPQNDENLIIKQIDKLNEELWFLKEENKNK